MAQYPRDLTEEDIFQAIINPNGSYDINPEDYALPEDVEDTEYVLPEDRVAPTPARKPPQNPTPLQASPIPTGRKTGNTRLDFAESVLPYAQEASRRTGVPADVLIAHAAEETGWGKHVHDNNYFNITGSYKGQSRTRGDTNAAGQKIRQDFRVYDTPQESFNDLAALIARRYPNAIGTQDALAYGTALKQRGYAEAPGYAKHIRDRATELQKAGFSSAEKGGFSPVISEQGRTRHPVNQVDPRLQDILTTAAQNSPYEVRFDSGYRPGDKRLHGQHKALDIELWDKRTGQKLPDYQDARNFREYEQFAQAVRNAQQEMYPELKDSLRWGGYFSGNIGKGGKYGAMDLMHFDLGGGPKLGMAAGSWEGGLNPTWAKRWGVASSLGMGAAPQPAPSNAPETYEIDLPNGGQLIVPGHMSREEAFADAKAKGIDIGPTGATREFALPNGGALIIPEGMSDEEAIAEAKANIPELADMVIPKPEAAKGHNVFKELGDNVLGGGKEALAGLYEGIGRFSSDPSWREDAKQFRAEAEKMRTEIPQEEVDAAYKQGFGSGVLKEFQQKGLYPAADMVGRYGHLFIPGSGVVKAAQFGLEAVASTGDTLHRAEQEGKEISDFNAAASGMVSSALATLGLPHTLSSGLISKVLGGASGKTIENVFKKEGAEAAEKLIGNRLADVARGAVESTAAGFGVMAGTDAAQRAAIGMDQMSPEELKGTLENAAWFSFMGLPSSLGAKGRRAEHLGYLKEQEALKQKDAELRGERPPEGQEEAPPAPSQMPDEEFPDLTKEQADSLREAEKKAADRAATQEVSDEEIAPPVEEPVVRGEEPAAPPVPPSDIATPATEAVAPEIPEPVVRGGEEAAPEIQPAHFSDALGIASKTGKKKDIPLKKALEQLDIENPQHQPVIAQALGEGLKLAEQGKIQLDIPKAQELLNTLQPPEVPSAQPIPQAGPTLRSRSPQPQIREEGGDQAVIGKGVEPSGQGIEAPEIKAPEVQAQEVAAPAPTAFKVEELPDNRIRVTGFKDAGIDAAQAQKNLLAAKAPKGQVTTDGLEFHKSRQGDVLNVLEGMRTPEVKAPEIAEAPEIKAPEIKAPEIAEAPEAKAPEIKASEIQAAPEIKAPEIKAPEAPVAETPIEQKVPSAPVTPAKPKRVSAEKEAKEALSPREVLAKKITGLSDTLTELHGQIKAEEAKPTPSKALLSQYTTRRQNAEQMLATLRGNQSRMLQAEEAKREQEAEAQAAQARKEAARKVQEQGGYEFDLLEAEKEGRKLEKETAARQTVPTLPTKPVKQKLREPTAATEEDIIKRIEEMQAKNAEGKKAEILPAKGEAAVANPHTKETIQAELKKLYGENAPHIEVSDRATEEVDEATKGFHEPSTGRTVLIADNIGKGEDLHGLVRHEVAVHAKKLGKTDKEFQSILKRVDDLRAQGAKDVIEAFDRVPEGTKPEDVTHEALAYLSQHKPKLPVVRAFQSWMRRTAHKLTGSTGWLKGDDFAVMADIVLKKAAKEPKAEMKAGKPEERLYAKQKPEAQERKLRDLTTITPSGPIAKLNNVKDAVSEVLTGVTSGKFRQAAIAQSEGLAKHLSKLETYSDYFGIRADLLRNQYDGMSHLFSHALNMGTPDISEGNMMKINKNSRLALGKWLKDSDKLEVDQKTAFGVLRALIGEARAKETGDIQRKIDTLTDYANRMKKAADGAEGRDRDKYRNKAAEARAKVRELSKKGDIDLGGLEKLVSAENIAEAHNLLKTNPKLADWVKRTHEINRAAVDFQYKTGVLDKATAADWKARPYIPLFKSLEQLAKEEGRSLQIMGGSAKSLGGRKRAKGGTQIVNVPENMLRSWIQMYTTGYTNHVRKVSVDQLRLFGGAEKTGPSDKMAVKVREGGKDTYWRVADKNLLSALEMSPFARNTFMDIVSAPSSLLRAGAIKTPIFWLKSLTREPLTANFTSRTGFVSPVKVAGEALKTLAGYNKGVDPLHQRGITGYYSSDVSPEAFTKALTKTSTTKKLGDFWNHIHTSFDTATRTAVQEEARKQGMKLGLRGEKLEDFAALRASEFANFATKGSSQLIHEFGRMTPFFNASLNSLDNLARSATGRNLNAREKAEARSLFRARAVGMAHFTMLYTLAQLNNPAYRNAANNEWLDNWMFDPNEEPGGMTRWKKVAAGFEPAFLFKTIPEALTRMYMGALTPKEATVSLFEKGKEKMLPPMVPLLPALLFEGQTGVNLVTGRATESLGMQKLPVEMRDKGASEIAKKIVEDYELGKMGISPVVLDTMGKGIAADIYSMATMMADLYLASNEGLSLYDKDMTQKYPVAKAIYTNPQNIQQTPTYFEGEAAAQQAVTGINKAANRGDVKAFERLMNDPELIADYKLSGPLRKIRENIQAIDASIAYIENMKVPEKEKERLFAEQIRLKHLYIKQGAEAVEGAKRSPD